MDGERPPARLSREVLAHLGRELRAMYADIIAEGVPEHFAAILRKLDEPDDEGPTPGA